MVWTKESARENERGAVQVKVYRVEADWLKEGGQIDHWTAAMMSALSFTEWKRGREATNRPAAKHKLLQ